MSNSPSALLLLALEDLPLPWDALDCMPYLRGLMDQAAWGAWSGQDRAGEAAVWRELWGGLLPDQSQGLPGVGCGLFNLPATWPPPVVRGWAVARMEQISHLTNCTHPPELAWDLGDYLSGQAALLRRPAPRPQQRDEAFAHWACLARLVWEHAERLLAASRPALAGVGFQGMAEVAALFGDNPRRVELFLAQVDDYLRLLAELLAPGAVICLAGGAGYLAWGPGRVPPGPRPEARPGDLAALALDLLGQARQKAPQG